jgi:ankyrin repeat protein
VAASRGSLEAAAAICRACKPFVNPVDVNGATPLDNARQRGHDAIVALLLTHRAKSGSDSSLQSDHDAIHEWAAKIKAEKLQLRKSAILRTLPESKMAKNARAVNTALQMFVKVCRTLSIKATCSSCTSVQWHMRA